MRKRSKKLPDTNTKRYSDIQIKDLVSRLVFARRIRGGRPHSLRRFALTVGIDPETLVYVGTRAIRKGLPTYDPTRGEFRKWASTVAFRAILNYLNDTSNHDPWSEWHIENALSYEQIGFVQRNSHDGTVEGRPLTASRPRKTRTGPCRSFREEDGGDIQN